jgi:hypothetical protein
MSKILAFSACANHVAAVFFQNNQIQDIQVMPLPGNLVDRSRLAIRFANQISKKYAKSRIIIGGLSDLRESNFISGAISSIPRIEYVKGGHVDFVKTLYNDKQSLALFEHCIAKVSDTERQLIRKTIKLAYHANKRAAL